mmetsp:Transcript_32557/g.56340  ORF Transcript_32557/g.56340 Transcript_32557/m.56340 type:complete len:316 (+) Transcript_32557:3338-4285(+)
METSTRNWLIFGIGVAAGALFIYSRRKVPAHIAITSDAAFRPVLDNLKKAVPELTEHRFAELSQGRGQFNLAILKGLSETSGLSVIYFTTVTSTNTLLTNALADSQYTGPAVFVADVQIQGRGRTGPWTSPEGCLMFSQVYTTEMRHALAVQIIIPLAIVRAIKGILKDSEKSTETLKVKWPNDVYLEGQKIAGVLVDSDPVQGLCRMVIGCGINVFNREPTTCLNEHFPGVFTREALLARYLFEFASLTAALPTGIATIQREYNSVWMHFNKPAVYQGKDIILIGVNLAEGSITGLTTRQEEVSVKSREDLQFL